VNLCKCGCGKEIIQKYSWYLPKYLYGHHNIGRTKETDEGRKNQADWMKNNVLYVRSFITNEGRKKQAEKQRKFMKDGGGSYASSFVTKEARKIGMRKKSLKVKGRTAENYEYIRKTAEKNRKRSKENDPYLKRKSISMKNGEAAWMNSFITNPSRPQTSIYENVKFLFPDKTVIINYPYLNFSLDIVILEHKVAIEYDGSYWHQDKEKDLKRQQELEEDGWKFIKYIDKTPSSEKLKEDILKLIDF